MRLPLLFLAFAITLSAEALTNGERDQAMSYLHATRKQFLDTVTPLTDAQLSFKPGPDRWSVTECAEHLAETETFLRGLIERLAKKLPVDEAKREGQRSKRPESFKTTQSRMADRSKKATAPEPARPTGRYPTKAAVVNAFKERRDATIRWVETTPDDLRGRFFKNGETEMDLYDMVVMISAHTERHLAQMREVMASPGFPGKE